MKTLFRIRHVLLIPLLLLVILSNSVRVLGEEEDEEENNDFLYNSEDALPVIEYHAKDEKEQQSGPDFFYAPNNGPRIVEFYAPWCPHCQHFRDHFIEFARQVDAVTDEAGADSIQFHAISCVAHKSVCRDFSIKGYPRLLLFPAGGGKDDAIDINYWELHPFDVLNRLGILVDEMNLGPAVEDRDTISRTVQRKESDVVIKTTKRTKHDIYNDAFLAFDFSLRNGIFTSNDDLSNSTKQALHSWLDLLRQSLPPVWKIHRIIHALLDNFELATNSEADLLQIIDQFPPPPIKTWSDSCTKGIAGMGYTCGLWGLFHIMAVGVVEWNMMLDGEQVEMILSPVSAANALRDFIANFFGCEICRNNFLTSFDECAFERCNRLTDNELDYEHWIQLPLWLYDMHNGVNMRLTREAAEREGNVLSPMDEISSQWPSQLDCPKCWYEDGSRDEWIYKFLRVEYWPDDFITKEYRNDLVEELDEIDDDDVPMPGPFHRTWTLPGIAVLAVGVFWHLKKMKHARTGRHKKIDS